MARPCCAVQGGAALALPSWGWKLVDTFTVPPQRLVHPQISMADFVEQQVARLHEQQLKANKHDRSDRRTADALLLLAIVFGFVFTTSAFVYFTAKELDEHWDEVGQVKIAEATGLIVLVVSVTGVLLWHICTSQHAGDLLGEVIPGAQHISSTLQSGRMFFFSRYWFKLQPPELTDKGFQLQYFLTQFADSYADKISIRPQQFQVRDVKQPRPGRPFTFRIDGKDSATGKDFKYVFACRTKKELDIWRKSLSDLSKADPTTLKKRSANVDLENGEQATLYHDGWMELESTASQRANNKVDGVKNKGDKAIAQQAVTVGALEDEDCTLWVGSLPESHVTEECLHELLGKFGEILSVTLRVKPADECGGDRTRSWAFVTFANAAAVKDAVATGVYIFGRSSMLTSSGASGHPLRLKAANVSSELRKRKGGQSEGALQSVADEHKLGKVGLHKYAQSMLDAVQVLPLNWKIVWSVGTIIIIVLGCTVLVAIPGSFFLPLLIWTPFIMKLGAPDDAVQTIRDRRNAREGVSPRSASSGGSGIDPSSAKSSTGRPVGLKTIKVNNPIHNMSMDSLSVSFVSSPSVCSLSCSLSCRIALKWFYCGHLELTRKAM